MQVGTDDAEMGRGLLPLAERLVAVIADSDLADPCTIRSSDGQPGQQVIGDVCRHAMTALQRSRTTWGRSRWNLAQGGQVIQECIAHQGVQLVIVHRPIGITERTLYIVSAIVPAGSSLR